MLTLYNSIGTPLDCKYIELIPHFHSMTNSHIVVASHEAFYVWVYKNVKQKAIVDVSDKFKAGMEKLVDFLFVCVKTVRSSSALFVMPSGTPSST